MVVRKVLSAFKPLVVMPWLSLGSPGVRDQVRTEQILFTMVWQRLRHKNRKVEGSDIDALGAGPPGSGWPGHSNLATMVNPTLVCPVRCLWLPVDGILTDSVSDALAEAGQSSSE